MKDTQTTDAMIVAKSLEKEAAPQLRRVSNLVIESQADFDLAGELLKNVKELAKQAKDKEDSLTQPLTKVVSGIRDLFRPFRTMVTQIETDTKARMLAYIQSNKDKQAKLEVKFKNGDIKKVSTLVAKTAELDINSSTAQIRKVWTAVCVNEKKTPREYLVADEQKIKAALKAGDVVAGWEWRQVEQIAI